MARPQKVQINSGLEGWDAAVIDNTDITLDGPFPVFRSATIAGLTTYAASSYEHCLMAVEDQDKIYFSDGTNWNELTTAAELSLAVHTITSSDTLVTADDVVLCDATSGNITVTLTAAAGNSGKKFYIKKIDSTTNNVVIAGAGGDLVDGSASFTITKHNDAAAVLSDGNDWYIL